MKRLLSIGFLFIFLFNTGGYYFIFWLRNQAKNELIRQLDAQRYSESETVELTIPVNLPYQLNQQDYERVDGEFAYEGHIYRFVKQKFEDGVLHIVCILSHKEKLLADAASDFTKITNDIPATSKQAVKLLVKLLKDYKENNALETISSTGWSRIIAADESEMSFRTRSLAINTPPPRFM